MLDQIFKHIQVFHFTKPHNVRGRFGGVSPNLGNYMGEIVQLLLISLLGPVITALRRSVVIKGKGVVYRVKQVFTVVKSNGPNDVSLGFLSIK